MLRCSHSRHILQSLYVCFFFLAAAGKRVRTRGYESTAKHNVIERADVYMRIYTDRLLSSHLFVHYMSTHFLIRTFLFCSELFYSVLGSASFHCTGFVIRLSSTFYNLTTSFTFSVALLLQLPLLTFSSTKVSVRAKIVVDLFFYNSKEHNCSSISELVTQNLDGICYMKGSAGGPLARGN